MKLYQMKNKGKTKKIAIVLIDDPASDFNIQDIKHIIKQCIDKEIKEDQSYTIITTKQVIDIEKIPEYYYNQLFIGNTRENSCKINEGILYNIVVDHYKDMFDTYVFYNPILKPDSELARLMTVYPNQIKIITSKDTYNTPLYIISYIDFLKMNGFNNRQWGYGSIKEYTDKVCFHNDIQQNNILFDNINIYNGLEIKSFYEQKSVQNNYPNIHTLHSLPHEDILNYLNTE